MSKLVLITGISGLVKMGLILASSVHRMATKKIKNQFKFTKI